MRYYIVRVYRGAAKEDNATLIGVVENVRHEQVGFHSVDELARILERDRDRGDAFSARGTAED
jgi:hypothetical protein